MLHQLLQDQDNAQAQAKATIALATEQGFPHYRAVGTVVHGWSKASRGQVAIGIAEIHQGLADYEATGARMWSPYFLGLLAAANGRAGRATAGISMVENALDQVGRTGGRWIEADLHRHQGELLLIGDKPDAQEAEACFRRALAVARQQEARMWELRAATSLARLWRDQGRSREARDLLAPIYGQFAEDLGTPALLDARRLLDGLA